MSEEEQISRIKVEATTTIDKESLKGLVDTKGTFGKGPYRTQVIDTFLFIIGSETDEGVTQHALNVIKSLTK
jgi:hypothetical protein